MQPFFSASLLTVVVVASVVAVGWFRTHPQALPDDNNKKTDGTAGQDEIDIVVDQSDPQTAVPSPGKERLNRRPHGAHTGSDRSDARPQSQRRQRDGIVSDATKPGPPLTPCYRAALAKGTQLNSFVRQCVSNIERTPAMPVSVPTPVDPMSSAVSQESPIDSEGMAKTNTTPIQKEDAEHRPPSLVDRSECEPQDEPLTSDYMQVPAVTKSATLQRASGVKGLASFLAATPAPTPVMAKNTTESSNFDADHEVSDQSLEERAVANRMDIAAPGPGHSTRPAPVKRSSGSKALASFLATTPATGPAKADEVSTESALEDEKNNEPEISAMNEHTNHKPVTAMLSRQHSSVASPPAVEHADSMERLRQFEQRVPSNITRAVATS